MQVIYERCAALDLGKAELIVCARTPDEQRKTDAASRSAASRRSTTSCWDCASG